MRRRRSVTRFLAVCAALAVVSCATPDRDETLQTIETERAQLNKRWQEARDGCQGDLDCVAAVNAVFVALYDRLMQLRATVIEEDWHDALERRRALEEELLELIPEYPHLRELLNVLQSSIADLEGEGYLLATPITRPYISQAAHPLVRGPSQGSASSHELVGSMTIYDDLFPLPVSITGRFALTGGWDSFGFAGAITGGQFVVSTPDGESFHVEVATEVDSALSSSVSADASGAGTLEMTLAFDPETVEGTWGAWFHSLACVTFPVTVHADGTIEFIMERGRLGDLLPYTPWPASDYNKDGVLDAVTDYNAFYIGWVLHERLADSNFDLQWTDDDVTLWQERFDEDYNH